MTDPYIASSLPDHQLVELYRLMHEEIREVAMFFTNPDGIITVWSRGAEDMKGYTSEEAIGQHLSLLYTEEDRARHWPEHNLREAAKHGFYREEQWRQRKDGSLFWASVSLTALVSHSGDLVGYSKITLDLSSHLELEECLKEKEERDRVLQAARAGIWKWDADRDTVDVSSHFLELLGYNHSEQTFSFKQWLDFVHPAEQQQVARRIRDTRNRAPQTPLVMQLRMRRHEGDYHWFYVCAARHQVKDDGPSLLGVNVDIHAMKTAQEERERIFEQLQTEKEQAQVTLSAIADGVITTDLDGAIISLNPAAERLTGWTESRAKGLAITEVFHARDESSRVATFNPVKQCLTEGCASHSRFNVMLINRHGQQYSIENSAAPIRLADGKMVGAVLVFHDVTESRQLLQELNHQATHDALTGLVNRMEFEARLERTVERAKPLAGPESVLLYMDLDQFKIVNDTCGHTDGDELLRQLAQVYQGTIRERDTLARIGGDEFALIAERCSVEEAVTIAEKILETTRRFRFTCRGSVFQVGISIGLVAINTNASTVEKLLREADHACYLAKEAGRNQVYVRQSDDVDIAQRRNDMQWVRRLDEARRNDRLKLYYQPIVPMNAEVGGLYYEILLRLNDEHQGLVGPSSFMPAAERYDVMPALDRWVLQQSLQWLEQNPDHVAALAMCTINLSRRTLADESFRQYVHEMLDATEVPADKICFEITENGAIANMPKTISFIEALAQRGCKFALDDFGTGMTSFSYLKQLPVDFIKIDGSFIQMMNSSIVDYEMVRFTNEISHMMGRKTIAEHVTSDTIMKSLRDIGIDYAQGNWLGEPRALAF